MVDSETIDNIYNFLNQSLRNQNKKCIITDLKPEYRIAIDKLGVKQQFCTFHLKQFPQTYQKIIQIGKRNFKKIRLKTNVLERRQRDFLKITQVFERANFCIVDKVKKEEINIL